MDQISTILEMGLYYTLGIVMLLGVLIFIHELGHFLVARWCGVRVETFSIGFGKKILQYQKGDTTYCLSLIPFGGYVKMYGDAFGAQLSEAEKPYSYLAKPIWQRISIALAGPLMNLLLAIAVFSILIIIGISKPGNTIGYVPAAGEAYNLGFRTGDKVLKIQKNDVHYWEQIDKKITNHPLSTLHFQIERQSTLQDLFVTIPQAKDPNFMKSGLVGHIKDLNFYRNPAILVFQKPTSTTTKTPLENLIYIKEINNTRVITYSDIFSHLKPREDNILSVVKFNNTTGSYDTAPVTITLNATQTQALIAEAQSQRIIPLLETIHIASIVEGSPAEKQGLLPGDRILKINDVAINNWEQTITAINSYNGTAPHKIDIQRDFESITLHITPEKVTLMNPKKLQEEDRYTVGFRPLLFMAPPPFVKKSTNNPLTALQYGVSQSYQWTIRIAMGLRKLVLGQISFKTMSGFVGIGKMAGETLKSGWEDFLNLMAIISINLFFINLLPIPILDGGHILLFTIEAIKGSPLSVQKVMFAQQIGLVLLLGIMTLTIFNDFNNFIFN